MEISENLANYYYAIVNSAKGNLVPVKLEEENIDEDDDKVVYLAINEDDDQNNDNVVENNLVGSEHLNSTLVSSNLKLITLEDGRMFISTHSTETEEEIFDAIEPHLLTSDHESIQDKNLEETTDSPSKSDDESLSDAQIQIVPVSGSPRTYKIVYNTATDEIEQLTEVEEPEKIKYKCRYKGCKRTYSTPYHASVHMRSHCNDKPFVCLVEGCHKRFATNYALKAHNRVHTGEKPYGCPVCEKKFKTSGDLHKHIRIHTGLKPFLCPIMGCGRSFSTSNIRKIHVRSHTGERPYICEYPNCGKAFSASTNYKNHIRIHSGEKPYACTFEGCDKRFTEYSSLYKHNRVHQIDKPFKCTLCNQDFKQESSLNIHKRMRHNTLISQNGAEIVTDYF